VPDAVDDQPQEHRLDGRVREVSGLLSEETLSAAWGPDAAPDARRRLVLAALLFGEEFDRRMGESPPASLNDRDFRRFLMGLMNAVVSRFAAHEGIPQDEAAAYLGDVSRRDRVLELNEALEAYANGPNRPLDDLLREAVEGRRDKAVWSEHWRGGQRG
jgi:hypothetical protein